MKYATMVKSMMVTYGKQGSQVARRQLVASREKISRSRGIQRKEGVVLLTRERYIDWKRVHAGDSKSDAAQSWRRDYANKSVC